MEYFHSDSLGILNQNLISINCPFYPPSSFTKRQLINCVIICHTSQTLDVTLNSMVYSNKTQKSGNEETN
jgi:hypothetical protein